MRRIRKHLTAAGMAMAIAAWLAVGGVASAAFPNFSDCPFAGLPSGSGCVQIQSQRGALNIKGFDVPLGNSLEIRGALREPDGAFVPPTGTNGFFAQSVNVPGGLLGIELPLSFNMVRATAELAGTAADMVVRPGDLEIRMPLKVRLSNPLIADDCHIGSNRNPVWVFLSLGPTSPPAPNRPISGTVGTVEFVPPDTLLVLDSLVVDNSFAIPGATGCGGLGLIDLLINAKLGLPSAAGNNSLLVENDAAVRLLP